MPSNFSSLPCPLRGLNRDSSFNASREGVEKVRIDDRRLGHSDMSVQGEPLQRSSLGPPPRCISLLRITFQPRPARNILDRRVEG
ncbi:hypothetical protein J1614_001392 [Plenodomus biglobosus]|nr:hypothetical protein J1614_001392 [Plenodomus biglobosus]